MGSDPLRQALDDMRVFNAITPEISDRVAMACLIAQRPGMMPGDDMVLVTVAERGLFPPVQTEPDQ